MKASTEHQLRLLELAGIDSDHNRLQHLAKHMPEQEHLVAIESDRRVRRQAAANARTELDAARADLERTRDDAKVVAERRARDENRLSKATSTKDIAALQLELDALARRSDKLVETELEQEELVGELERQFERAQRAMDELEELAADLLERRELARDHIRSEAKQLHERRGQLTARIPAELLQEYERARQSSGIGAAELVGKVSTAANLELGQSELKHIRGLAADDVAYCPFTGAILVRTARSDLR